MEKRDPYWDVVKGAGALLVLIGHTGAWLTPYLYMYHVALFFFVAGYFYKDKYTAEPFHYLGTRFAHLWWPCVKYGFVFVVLHNLLFSLGVYSDAVGVPLVNTRHPYGIAEFLSACVHSFTLQSWEEMLLALWFIVMMMADLFLLCGLRHGAARMTAGWRREALVLAGVLGVYLAGCWLTEHKAALEYYFQLSCVLLLPTYLGYAYHHGSRWIRWRWLWCLAGGGLVVFVYHHTGTWVELSQNRILGPKWFALATSAGIAFHLGACAVLQRLPAIGSLLAYAGRKSLHIIALHFLAFKAAAYLYIQVKGLPMVLLAAFPVAGYPLEDSWWWLVFVSFGLLLPLGAVRLYDMAAARLGDRRSSMIKETK